jgi:site-specific DNA-methyltransferase (adenine-specific)
MSEERQDAPGLIYNKDFLNNNLPDKCANLIISDPPYFEVKGEFDFIWPSFDAYLSDVEKWAAECKRLLSDSGTLFWWGMDKKIAYSQIILDRYFYLVNTLVWERPGISSEWDSRRSFPERGMERILMYANFSEETRTLEKTGLQQIYSNPDCFSTIKSYMRTERDKLMRAKGFNTMREFEDFINEWIQTKGMARHYFSDSQWALPTQKMYERMQETGFWQRPYEGLRQEYEGLRQEYEGRRRVFNNTLKLTDILKFPQDTYGIGHDTPKPEKLTRALILTCSRPGDLVLVPFAGSGTECAMSIREGRRFVGYEIDAKHAAAANARCHTENEKYRHKPTLFAPEQMYGEQVKIFESENLKTV